MREVYLADDGKIFETEEECRKYELCGDTKSLEHNVVLLDSELHPIAFEDIQERWVEAMYIFFKTKDSITDLYELVDKYTDDYFPSIFMGERKPGLYIYNVELMDWEYFPNLHNNLSRQLKNLEDTNNRVMSIVNQQL